jgi:hypothetical protein
VVTGEVGAPYGAWERKTMAFAMKTEVSNPQAKRFEFTAQKMMLVVSSPRARSDTRDRHSTDTLKRELEFLGRHID